MSDQPDMMPPDEAPQVLITDAHLLELIHRLRGMDEAVAAIDAQKVEGFPGVKLARSAILAVYHELRCTIMARCQMIAGKAGVDGTKWVVSGFERTKRHAAYRLTFISLADADREGGAKA